MEDLMQEGYLELWRCCERFNENQGTAFSTYAVPNITGVMRRYLREKSRVIRLPRSILDCGDSDLINEKGYVLSLDIPIDEDSNTDLHEIIQDPKSEDYENLTEDLVESFLKTIKNSRDKAIMEEYYYGIIWFEKPHYKYIMEKYNIAQPTYIRIIHKYNEKFKEFIERT